MRLYEKLLNQKNNGEELMFDNITKEELTQLWWEESMGDALIAKLFDVSAYRVKDRRYTWGIKQHDMIFKDFMIKMNEARDKEQIPEGETTQRVERIAKQINSCTSAEQIAIIQHLGEINTDVKAILKEARAYRIFLRAAQGGY